MPIYNNINYPTLPQQVKKNKDDINGVSNLETEAKTIVPAINENKGRIDANELDIIVLEDTTVDQQEQIDSINDTLAAGGILVSRRVETSAPTIGTGAAVKIDFDVTTKETEDVNVIAFDANNDNILKLDTAYDISAGFTADNTLNQVKNILLELVAKDQVTLIETVIDSRSIDIPAQSTVAINPNYIYTKADGSNDILLTVRETSDVGVNIQTGAQLSVSSKTATSGTGIATKTKNIGLDDPSTEALSSDDSETTAKENFQTLKTMIEKDANDNTVIKRNNVNALVVSTSAVDFGARTLNNLSSPTVSNQAATKGFVETLIADESGNTVVKRSGENYIQMVSGVVRMLRELSMQNAYKITNVLDPVNDQDVVNKRFMEAVIRTSGGTTTYISRAGVDKIVIGSSTTQFFNKLSMENNQITNVLDPTDPQDVATKKYVEDNFINTGDDVTITAGTNVTIAGKGVHLGKIMTININFTTSATISAGAVVAFIPAPDRPDIGTMVRATELSSNLNYDLEIPTNGEITARETIPSGDTISLTCTYISS